MIEGSRFTTRIAAMAVLLMAAITASCVAPESIDSPPRTRISYRHPLPPRPSITDEPVRLPPPRKARPAPFHPEWFPPGGRISPRWTCVVIHHSATKRGSATEFDRFQREHNGWDELGYHFVIGNGTSTPDGCVEVGPRWRKQKHGAHCKTPGNYYNEHGIGICLVGDFEKSRPSPKQLASLNELLRFLSTYCGIGPGQVTTHGAVTGKTQCPGRFLPIAAIRRAMQSPVNASDMPRG